MKIGTRSVLKLKNPKLMSNSLFIKLLQIQYSQLGCTTCF